MWRLLIVCVLVGMAVGYVRPGASASGGRSGPTSTKRSATRPGRGAIKPGICVSLKGHRPFPPDNPWNRDISAAPIDPNSARLLAGIGLGRNLHPDFGPKGGIAYVVVTAAQRVDCDIRDFPAAVQVILTGLKKYGMILSDNGGDFFITGAPDLRWDNKVLVAIKRVKGKDLEVVKMENMVADR